MVDELLLRKLQRQRKIEDFTRAAGRIPGLQLAAARLRGPEALRDLASNTVVPAGDRELATWASGDLRAGLMALRRHSGCAEVAEGWLLLLKGEAERALARFEAGAAIQPRRAAAGATVALAVLGRLDQAGQRWATVGPVPGAVFPAAGALTRQLTRHEAGWDPSALHRLLVAGDLRAVETAWQACPTERVEERAWISLRLADLLWQADPRDQRVLTLWKLAWHAPALHADVLKRRFHWSLRVQRESEMPEAIREVAELHRLLQPKDPVVARRCVEELTRDLSGQWLNLIDNPWVDTATCEPKRDAPNEWILVWLRQAGPLVEDMGGMMGMMARMMSRETGIALPPTKLAAWRPWLRRLDAVYAADPVYLEAKLGLLEHFQQHGELRLVAYQMLLAQPERCEEFLPRWGRSAEADRRSKKTQLVELAKLQEVYPGRIDLAGLHLRWIAGGAAAVQAQASAMPPLRAAVFRWMHGQGEPPAAASLGQDDDADLHLIRHAAEGGREVKLIRQLITVSPERLHQCAGLLLRRGDTHLLRDFAGIWSKHCPKDWRGWYHLGKAHAALRNVTSAIQHFQRAKSLLGASQQEFSEVTLWLQRHEEDDGPWDEDEDEDADFGLPWPPLPPPPRPPARPPQPPQPSPPPKPTPPVRIRDAARLCGMEGALVLSGLDAEITQLDQGLPLTALSAAQRQQLARFLDALLGHMPASLSAPMRAIRRSLA